MTKHDFDQLIGVRKKRKKISWSKNIKIEFSWTFFGNQIFFLEPVPKIYHNAPLWTATPPRANPMSVLTFRKPVMVVTLPGPPPPGLLGATGGRGGNSALQMARRIAVKVPSENNKPVQIGGYYKRQKWKTTELKAPLGFARQFEAYNSK